MFEIYEVAQKQTLDNIPVNERQLTCLILEYKYYLDSEHYAQTTKNIKLNVIYSFCRAFDFYVPKIRLKRKVCEDKNRERPITKKEIILMLKNSPLREGAFLVLQATSGMSSKEARELTVHNLINVINTNLQTNYETIWDVFNEEEKILSHDAFEIKLTRSKVDYRYITFISNECMRHLLNYLHFRAKQTDNKKLKNKPHEPIFITNKGEKMDSKAVTGMYREMGARVGFTTDENTYRFWRSHNIRKYFYNIVEETVGIEYADEWLGHVPSKVTRAYARRDNRMKQAYLKCLPYLQLEEDVRVVEKKLHELEEELMRLKGELG
ncbi:MAG: tyrosine-type recombinase/integrase [Methanobrevibacter sp.]|nr:tyrosine-type recombinase/integrase [Methanobrevibacter sp.]